MLTQKTINVSARSDVTVTTDEGNEVVTVMTLNGSCNSNGYFNITRCIRNREAYIANKAQMIEDADAFEAMLLAVGDNK